MFPEQVVQQRIYPRSDLQRATVPDTNHGTFRTVMSMSKE